MDDFKFVIHKGPTSSDAMKTLIDKRVDKISLVLEDMSTQMLRSIKDEIEYCSIKNVKQLQSGAVSFFTKCYNVCIWNANSKWRAVV